jgi:hypothetical protein
MYPFFPLFSPKHFPPPPPFHFLFKWRQNLSDRPRIMTLINQFSPYHHHYRHPTFQKDALPTFIHVVCVPMEMTACLVLVWPTAILFVGMEWNMAKMTGREQIKGCYGNARQREISELWRETSCFWFYFRAKSVFPIRKYSSVVQSIAWICFQVRDLWDWHHVTCITTILKAAVEVEIITRVEQPRNLRSIVRMGKKFSIKRRPDRFWRSISFLLRE